MIFVFRDWDSRIKFCWWNRSLSYMRQVDQLRVIKNLNELFSVLFWECKQYFEIRIHSDRCKLELRAGKDYNHQGRRTKFVQNFLFSQETTDYIAHKKAMSASLNNKCECARAFSLWPYSHKIQPQEACWKISLLNRLSVPLTANLWSL